MMFRCDFGKGVTCEMEIGDEPPTKGTSHVLEIQWTYTPTIKTLRLYKAWMNSVNKMLADKWGFTFMHVFMLQKAAMNVGYTNPASDRGVPRSSMGKQNE